MRRIGRSRRSSPAIAGPIPCGSSSEALRDAQGLPCPKEHFGYTDGISDPVFEGQYAAGEEQARSIGFGATDGAGNWRPLAAGEFLLGWPDEAQEIPGAAMPLDFSRNGTFFAYRKLHQDVDAFKAWVEATAATLQQVWKLATLEEARETLLAKMAGRWSDGVPLAAAPTYADWLDFNLRCPPPADHRVRDNSERAAALVRLSAIATMPDGTRLPARRACPPRQHPRHARSARRRRRQGSRMGSALNNRRRILRRGLPYGKAGAEDGEHGVIMMVVCASLQRQFEFVQQQWINYGLDCEQRQRHLPGDRQSRPGLEVRHPRRSPRRNPALHRARPQAMGRDPRRRLFLRPLDDRAQDDRHGRGGSDLMRSSPGRGGEPCEAWWRGIRV